MKMSGQINAHGIMLSKVRNLCIMKIAEGLGVKLMLRCHGKATYEK